MAKSKTKQDALKIKNRFFPHDIYANADEKIAYMMYYFRQNKSLYNDSLLSYAALGVYWTIIQHLYSGTLSESKLHVFADDKRINLDFLKLILTEFNLFENQDGCYISNRVQEEIKKMKEISAKARASANRRWYEERKQPKKEKTEEEKLAEKDAEAFLRTSCIFPFHQELVQYDEYRILEYTAQKEAVLYYQKQLKNFSKKTALKNLLAHLKGDDKDEK